MNRQELFFEDMFGEGLVTHKVSQTPADLDRRVSDLEAMMQIQQEQIEIINKIFQKVFGGLASQVEDLKVAGD
jgi:hypothetical protein